MMTPIEGKVDLTKTGNTIDLRQVRIVWNSLRAEIQGRAQLKDKGSPDIHLLVKTGNFSLADMAGFLPPAQQVRPKGQGNIELRADGPADAPALSGQASLTGVSISYEGQSLSGLKVSAKFAPETISAQAQGNWNDGNFQINLNARNYRTSPDVQMNGQLSLLDLSKLPQNSSAPAAKAGSSPEPSSGTSTRAEEVHSPRTPKTAAQASSAIHTSGQFTIDKIVHPNFTASKSAFVWDLKNANMPSRITGTAKFDIGQGRFDDLQTLSASQGGLVQALLLPITVLQKVGGIVHIPLLPSFGRVNFKTITGNYNFQKGIMTIQESHMDSDAAYVTAAGKADLGKETLDMHIATRLLVQGLSGPIGFQVGGTFSNPSVKPDVASILKQPVVNDVIQQGTKLLQNLFK